MMTSIKSSPPKANEKDYKFNLTVFANPTTDLEVTCDYHDDKKITLKEIVSIFVYLSYSILKFFHITNVSTVKG